MKTTKALTLVLTSSIATFTTIAAVSYWKHQQLPQTERVATNPFLEEEVKEEFSHMVAEIASSNSVQPEDISFSREPRLIVGNDGKFTGKETDVFVVNIAGNEQILFSPEDTGDLPKSNDLFDETVCNFSTSGLNYSINGINTPAYVVEVVHTVGLF